MQTSCVHLANAAGCRGEAPEKRAFHLFSTRRSAAYGGVGEEGRGRLGSTISLSIILALLFDMQRARFITCQMVSPPSGLQVIG